MKKFVLIYGLCSIAVTSALAQTADSTASGSTLPAGLTISGYVEAYYSHDLTAPATTQERPNFLYNYRRNREVNLNLGYLKAAYATDRFRSNLALQIGTYPQYNYAAEQELLKNVLEANAGVRLSRTRDLWLDAGVFGSHIGFESAIGKDNWTLTRSLVAENSPYYLAGAKLTYNTPNGKWTLLGSVVNGWQRIRRLDGYKGPALSTQIQWKPGSAFTLNWSTFLGSDRPDSLKQTRFYNNIYAIVQPGKLGLTLGFDIGADRKPLVTGRRVGSGSYVWYTPVAIVRYAASDKINLAGRIEYYNDRNGVIIATGTAAGFQTWGYSVNLDYKLLTNAVWRIEGRLFNSKDAIFETNTNLSRTNAALTTSLAVWF